MIAYVIKNNKEGYSDTLYTYSSHLNEATLFSQKHIAEGYIEQLVRNGSVLEGEEYVIQVEIKILKKYPPKE